MTNDQVLNHSSNNPHYPTTQTFYSKRKVKHNILKDKVNFSNNTQFLHFKLASDRMILPGGTLIILKPNTGC